MLAVRSCVPNSGARRSVNNESTLRGRLQFTDVITGVKFYRSFLITEFNSSLLWNTCDLLRFPSKIPYVYLELAPPLVDQCNRL